MTIARRSQSATLLPSGLVLIAGGMDAHSNGLASAELYDDQTGTFRGTGSMTTARAWHSATALSDGRVLVAGGSDSSLFSGLDSAELYEPASGTFGATGSMGAARNYQTATIDGVTPGRSRSPPFASGESRRGNISRYPCGTQGPACVPLGRRRG